MKVRAKHALDGALRRLALNIERNVILLYKSEEIDVSSRSKPKAIDVAEIKEVSLMG